MSRLPHGVVVPVTGPPQPHDVEVHADTVRRPNPTVQKKEVRSVRGGRRPAVLSVSIHAALPCLTRFGAGSFPGLRKGGKRRRDAGRSRMPLLWGAKVLQERRRREQGGIQR